MIIKKAEDFITTNWSGGSTTELYIYPEESKYADRNFDFRLSTATVEVEQSTFTPLPGISRTLMVLKGQMELRHENEHSKLLKPFDIDEFDGGWKTKSQGCCVDFNLMCRGNYSGGLYHLKMEDKERAQLDFESGKNLIYLAEGQIQIKNRQIDQGSLIIFEEEMIEIDALEASNLILIHVRH